MQVYQASAAKGDNSFLHIGYMSASRKFRSSIGGDVKESYRNFSEGVLALDRSVSFAENAGEMQRIAEYYPNLTEHAWQAPVGTASLFKQNILVSPALELEGYPVLASTDSTTSAAKHLASVGVVLPKPPGADTAWDPKPFFSADMLIAIFVFVGIFLLIYTKPTAQRKLKYARALASIGMILAIAVPVTYAFARDQLSPYPVLGGVQVDRSSEMAAALYVPPGPITGVPVWKMGEKLKYKNPDQATMVLMHGLISPALYFKNEPVDELSWLKGSVSIPGGNYRNNGISYAQAFYGLDGWGNEFRLSTEVVEWTNPASNRPLEWLTTLQSAGADSEFDTADDYKLTSKLRHKEVEKYYRGNEDFHYAAFIANKGSSFESFISQKQGDTHVVYLPNLIQRSSSEPLVGKFSPVYMRPGARGVHRAGNLILAGYNEMNSDQLALQIYCHPLLNQQEGETDG